MLKNLHKWKLRFKFASQGSEKRTASASKSYRQTPATPLFMGCGLQNATCMRLKRCSCPEPDCIQYRSRFSSRVFDTVYIINLYINQKQQATWEKLLYGRAWVPPSYWRPPRSRPRRRHGGWRFYLHLQMPQKWPLRRWRKSSSAMRQLIRVKPQSYGILTLRKHSRLVWNLSIKTTIPIPFPSFSIKST